MISSNYIELDKIVLIGWVDKALHQTLSRKNIILGFKSIRIWPLDLKVTYERTRPSNLYTIVNKIGEKQDDDYQSNQGEDGEMEWVEHNVEEKLINIISTTKSMCNKAAQN
jgi:hypothetical protein